MQSQSLIQNWSAAKYGKALVHLKTYITISKRKLLLLIIIYYKLNYDLLQMM